MPSIVDDAGGNVGNAPEDVNTAPVLTVDKQYIAIAGSEISIAIAAADAENDALSFSFRDLPEWLTFNQGAQTLVGTSSWLSIGSDQKIEVTVTDGMGEDAEEISIRVEEPVATPEIAGRFLTQATFGPDLGSIETVTQAGITGWLDEQLGMESAYDVNAPEELQSHLDLSTEISTFLRVAGYPFDPDIVNPLGFQNTVTHQMQAWWEHALFADDQLRQRMGFALSELMVVSDNESPLNVHGEALALYQDILVRNSFGNFRKLLGDVSRSIAMGIYLSHHGNMKGDPASGRTPDENFAREIMQLFTIGLMELNSNGTRRLDSSQNLVPTYTQDDIEELARVFTGWTKPLTHTPSFAQLEVTGGFRGGGYDRPMECLAEYHDFDAKTVLGKSIPAGLDCEEDMDAALDIIFAHPNVGPFVSLHLIRHFVTSNPSAGYVGRVASVFNDNGSGERGDLGAVLKAVLLDNEARDGGFANSPAFGKFKSPILMTSQFFRALNPYVRFGYARIKDGYIAPLRAFSVFNFYQPDFVPTNPDFVDSGLVAPEAQILNDGSMPVAFNMFLNSIKVREARGLVMGYIAAGDSAETAEWRAFNPFKLDANGQEMMQTQEQIETQVALNTDILTRRKYNNYNNQIHIDLVTQVDMMEKALDPFADRQSEAAKTAAIDALLNQLDLLLFYGRYDAESMTAVRQFLMGEGLHPADPGDAIKIARDAVFFMTTSSDFAIQK